MNAASAVLPSGALNVPAVAQGWTNPEDTRTKDDRQTETLRPPLEEGRVSESDVTQSLTPARPPTPLASPSAPPDGDCEACWSHSCRRSNTQVGCTSTLKAHQAQTLLVGNTLFMTEACRGIGNYWNQGGLANV